MTRRLVFDSHEWQKTGDIGDNSQFWKPAKIIKMNPAGTCDVLFEDGHISKGHFYSATRELESEKDNNEQK